MIANTDDTGRLLLVKEPSSGETPLRQELAALGWDVTLAASVEEAKRRLSATRMDAVLVDWDNAGGNPEDLLQRTKWDASAPPVVVLAQRLDPEQTVRLLHQGAADTRPKSATTHELALCLCQAVGLSDRWAHPGQVGDATRQLVGETRAIEGIRSHLRQLARYRPMPCLILGNGGSGRHTAAQVLHQLAGTPEPMVKLDCTKPESQRWIYELWEKPQANTVLLNEVFSLSLESQRFLQRNLKAAEAGQDNRGPWLLSISSPERTRGDHVDEEFLFTISGYSIHVPDLAQRRHDVALLAKYFLQEALGRNRQIPRLSAAARQALSRHEWPGNVAELRRVITHLAQTITGNVISEQHAARALEDAGDAAQHRLPGDERPSVSGFPALERQFILDAFERSNHNMSATARSLKIPRSTLRDKLRRYTQS